MNSLEIEDCGGITIKSTIEEDVCPCCLEELQEKGTVALECGHKLCLTDYHNLIFSFIKF